MDLNAKEQFLQTLYFKNGKMYKVYPTDKESWYDARYLVSDGKRYDLEAVQEISKIPIPRFDLVLSFWDNYGVAGSLDYVIRMKAGSFYTRNEKELCSACLWKSTELMFFNSHLAWRKRDYVRLITWHAKLGMQEEVEKALDFLIKKGFIFTDVELKNLTAKNKKHETRKTLKQDKNFVQKKNLSYVEKEFAIVERITTDDMLSLENMPFICNAEVKKFVRDGGRPFAYMDILGENIENAKREIEKMNKVIKLDLKRYPELPKNLKIDTDKLVFQSRDYGYTRIICNPKTYTEKPSKYPYSLFFTTDLSIRDISTHGELVYGQNGKIEKATINFWKTNNHVFLIYKTIDGHLTLVSIE